MHPQSIFAVSPSNELFPSTRPVHIDFYDTVSFATDSLVVLPYSKSILALQGELRRTVICISNSCL